MFIDRNFHDYRPKCTFKNLGKKLNNVLIVTLFDSILAFLEIFTKPGSKYSETVKLN
jgi:hypothetical protein